jgi:hypothetical protein
MAMCYDDSIGETRPFYQVDAWLCSIQVVWRVVGGSGHCGEPFLSPGTSVVDFDPQAGP